MAAPNHRERLALIVIIAVGAWLRFQHLGDIEYNIDQVYPVWQALNTLDEGHVPLVGQGTSVLFANPPLTGYFFTPMIALLRQPIAAYTLTLILNTFAIWLAYRALRWLIGTRPALVGAALFAVNPWIIEDSRRTWVQSLSPFFVCLIFWALAPVLTRQTRHPQRRLLIALIGLALFAHTYLLAYALIAPVSLLLILFWRQIPKRPLIVGGMAFTVLMALYGIGLARQWDDTTQRAKNFSSGQARLSDEALTHAVRLVTGWEYAAARGTRAPADDSELRNRLSDALNMIWILALVTGMGRAVVKACLSQELFGNSPLQNRADFCPPHAMDREQGGRINRDIAVILLLWFLLPILMMSYVSRIVHPFYLLLTVPAGHGLAAWGIVPLLQRHRLAWIAAVLMIVTGVVNGLNTVRFAQETAAHPGEHLPETLPLAAAAHLGSQIRAELTPGMAVLSPMEEWTPITIAGRVIRTEQIAGFETAQLIPEQGGLYITFNRADTIHMSPPLIGQRAGPPLILGDGTRIDLYRAYLADLVITHPADIPSDIDVNFAGWTLNGDLSPGEPIHLTTFWHITALHPDRGVWTFAPYLHLLDPHRTVLTITTGEVVSALDWQPGDVIAQQFTLTVPDDATGPFTFNTGLYDSVRGVNAIFRIPTDGEITFTPDIGIVP